MIEKIFEKVFYFWGVMVMFLVPAIALGFLFKVLMWVYGF